MDKDAPIRSFTVIERVPRPACADSMLEELRRLVARVRRERPFLDGYELADVTFNDAGPDLRVALAFVPIRRNRLCSAERIASGR